MNDISLTNASFKTHSGREAQPRGTHVKHMVVSRVSCTMYVRSAHTCRLSALSLKPVALCMTLNVHMQA